MKEQFAIYKEVHVSIPMQNIRTLENTHQVFDTYEEAKKALGKLDNGNYSILPYFQK